jgi:hypothetical protein
VFLGAVALLRLKGLLCHRDCSGSSPSGLGDGLSLPPEGTQTRLAPESARRVVVRRMIGRVREGCQTWPGSAACASVGDRTRPHADVRTGHAPILPWGIAESPCGACPGGAILSGPSAPETYKGYHPESRQDPREVIDRCQSKQPVRARETPGPVHRP